MPASVTAISSSIGLSKTPSLNSAARTTFEFFRFLMELASKTSSSPDSSKNEISSPTTFGGASPSLSSNSACTFLSHGQRPIFWIDLSSIAIITMSFGALFWLYNVSVSFSCQVAKSPSSNKAAKMAKVIRPIIAPLLSLLTSLIKLFIIKK